MLSGNTVRHPYANQAHQQLMGKEAPSRKQSSSRPVGERRSSGSKLIICSPTPSHLMNNHSTILSQHPAVADSRSQAYPLQSPEHDSGASALLTFLGGSDRRRSITDVRQKRNQSNRRFSESADVFAVNTCGSSLILTKERVSLAPLVHSNSVHPSAPCYSPTPIVECGMKMRSSTSLLTTASPECNFINVPPAAALVRCANGLEDMRVNENASPVSPDSTNMPMDSCFANILGDQGSDSFDLNNITPSIQLTTSVDVPESILDYTQPAICSQPSTNSSIDVHPRSNIRLTPLDESHTRVKMGADENLLIQASTSCPAEMQGTLQQPLGISPVQATVYSNAQACTSGSGSLGGMSGGTDLVGDNNSGGAGGGTSVLFATSCRNPADPRTVWMRDRSKKDSHNRIERKRRDYINCQITELGNLLPEDMFRDGDGKKNKGSILKNSVEFICSLRSELNQLPEIRKEATLAAKVIGQLVKRIQDLEAMINHHGRISIDTDNLEYQRSLHEWLLIHEHNMQRSTVLSPVSTMGYNLPPDVAGSVSPGLSSVGAEEFIGTESKSMFLNSNSFATSAPTSSVPVSSGSQLTPPMASLITGISNNSPTRNARTRCTSLTVAGTAYPTTSQCASALQVSSLHPPGRQQRYITATQQRPTQQPLFELSSSSSSSARGHHDPSHVRLWHQQSGMHDFSPQSMVPHQALHRPVSGEEQAMHDNLSASLPASVHPLLCGLQYHGDEDKLEDPKCTSNLYTFGQDDLLSHLKREPPSDSSEHISRRNPSSFPTSQFEALVPASSTSMVITNNDSNNHGGGCRPSEHHSTPRGSTLSDGQRPSARSMHFDWGSPTPIGFEPDDFQFDEDVPME